MALRARELGQSDAEELERLAHEVLAEAEAADGAKIPLVPEAPQQVTEEPQPKKK
jgi:hypothetical protein